MNPPPYATRSHGLAPAFVDESEHLQLGRPGRLAPKWLADFVDGCLMDAAPFVLDVGCANMEFKKAVAAASGDASIDPVDPPAIRHELLVKGHQSNKGELARGADGKECREVYSCICQNCRYHFTFYVDRGEKLSCGLNHNNTANPLHHLVFHFSEDKPVPLSINLKYYPYLGRTHYMCSAAECGFRVAVEVSGPRFSQHFLDYLSDNDRIRQRLQRAIEREPERFGELANVPPNALTYLRVYLRDISEGKKDKAPDGKEVEKKIDQRNKRFYVQFGDGPETAELLHFLEFEEVHDGETRMWKLPYPEITRPTRPGSRLAFYQDVKSEVETIIVKDSQNMRPNMAISFLTNAFDMENYTTSKTPFAQYDTMDADVDLLGITADMYDSYLWYAFTCQRQTDPAKAAAFFSALRRLAQGRDNEELHVRIQSYASLQTEQPPGLIEEDDQIRRATELSLQDYQPTSTSQNNDNDGGLLMAYEHFGLKGPPESDDELIGRFESLTANIPSQRSICREKLLLIARLTNNKNLQDRAVETMDLAEALAYLGVQADTEAEYIVNIAQFSSNSGEKDYVLVATALHVIGVARNNDSTLIQPATLIMAGRDQSYRLDGSLARSGMDLDMPASSSEPVNLGLPVGLQNIRNTCYLNSILQYLFTVKPIREIVLDSDKHGLENTESNLENRRIDPGSTRLEKGEAFAGQQFVEQLSVLFTELLNSRESAIKPQQKLALAALKNPKQLETDGARILVKDQEQDQDINFSTDLPFVFSEDKVGTGKESPAPPLPVRHAPPPPVPPRTAQPATRVQVSAVSEVDNTDASSTMSSQTLVNNAEEGWQTVGQINEDDSSVRMQGVFDIVLENDDKPPPYETVVADSSHPPYEDFDVKMAEPKPLAGGPGTEEGAEEEGIKTVFDPPPTVPIVAEPTVEEKIARALNDSSVTGTDQQDVEEVMGNIISHLRAAVKATGEDEDTGAQRDAVTDTFFWTSATYNRSNGAEQYNRQVSPNRWVTAYPDEGGKVINLLQALDNSFQREFITQGTTRYERFTSILKLPPILHMHIQRTTRDGGKNNTAINIPEVLYLDRFMDSPVDSELFTKRRRAWNLQERLRSLKGPNGEPPTLSFTETALDKAAAYTDALVENYLAEHSPQPVAGGDSTDAPMEGIGSVSANTPADTSVHTGDAAIPALISTAEDEDGDDYIIINSDIKALMNENGVALPTVRISEETAKTEPAEESEPTTSNEANSQGAAGASTDQAAGRTNRTEMTTEEIREAWRIPEAVELGNRLLVSQAEYAAAYQQELDSLFLDMTEQKYLLHAVICHAGQTGKSGHYWVWIYDFARKLWRRYNDSVVTEEPDSDKVMRQLSTQGEPYYLAYVRAEDVDGMVDIPSRQPAGETEAAAAAAAAVPSSTSPLTKVLSIVAPTPLSPPPLYGQQQQSHPLESVIELDEDSVNGSDTRPEPNKYLNFGS